MNITDLQVKVASEEAVLGLQKHMASIKYFAHNFTPDGDREFGGVVVPVFNLSAAAEFAEGTNDWCGGENLSAQTVSLEKHFIKSVALEDINTDVNRATFLRDGARAIAETVGRAANKYVYGLINSTNVPLSATMPTTKATFAGLLKICDDNGVNPYECVLALNPESYGNLLSLMDYTVIGTSEAVKYGVVENLYGFRAVVMTSYLPAGVKGAIIPYDTIGVVSRLNTPTVNGYVATWNAEDDNGFAIGFRVFEHLCYGKAFLGGDVLVGAKIMQPGIIRLV